MKRRILAVVTVMLIFSFVVASAVTPYTENRFITVESGTVSLSHTLYSKDYQ